jgi:hypothetical protein
MSVLPEPSLAAVGPMYVSSTFGTQVEGSGREEASIPVDGGSSLSGYNDLIHELTSVDGPLNQYPDFSDFHSRSGSSSLSTARAASRLWCPTWCAGTVSGIACCLGCDWPPQSKDTPVGAARPVLETISRRRRGRPSLIFTYSHGLQYCQTTESRLRYCTSVLLSIDVHGKAAYLAWSLDGSTSKLPDTHNTREGVVQHGTIGPIAINMLVRGSTLYHFGRQYTCLVFVFCARATPSEATMFTIPPRHAASQLIPSRLPA